MRNSRPRGDQNALAAAASLLALAFTGAVLFDGRFLEDAANANGFGDTVYGYADVTLTL